MYKSVGSGWATSDDSQLSVRCCLFGLLSGDGFAIALEKQRFRFKVRPPRHLIGRGLSSDANRDSERDI